MQIRNSVVKNFNNYYKPTPKNILKTLGLATLMTAALSSCDRVSKISSDDYLKYMPAYPAVKPIIDNSKLPVEENAVVRINCEPFLILNGEKLDSTSIYELEQNISEVFNNVWGAETSATKREWKFDCNGDLRSDSFYCYFKNSGCGKFVQTKLNDKEMRNPKMFTINIVNNNYLISTKNDRKSETKTFEYPKHKA